MGYIGDYIHAKAESYRQYGIRQTGTGGTSFQVALRKARDELRQFQNISKLEKSINISTLEKEFNDLKNGQKVQGIQLTQADQNAFLSTMNQILGNNKLKDFSNMSAEAIEELFDAKKMKYDQNSKNYSDQTLQRFENLLQNFANSIQAAFMAHTITAQTAKELEQKRKELETLSKQLKQQKITSKGAWSSIFDSYNQIVKDYTTPTPKDLGEFAEIETLFIMSILSGKTAQEAQQIVEEELIRPLQSRKFWTGAQGSKTEILNLSNRFVDGEALTAKNPKTGIKNWTYKKGGVTGKGFTISTTTSSQDTVDIQLSLTGKPKDIRASIKNYGSFQNIKIISGAPLASLFNLINTDFINHYINLLALNNSTGGKELKSDRDQANAVMGQTAFVRGLIGARSNTATSTSVANLFIVNNRSSNQVRIVNTASMIRKILGINNLASLDQYIDVKTLPKKVNNKWVGEKTVNDSKSAQMRITAIIAQLRQKKLSVSIKNLDQF